MAHQCPDCWITCYCNGDLDDCILGERPPNGGYCRHDCPEYKFDECDDDDYDRPALPSRG